MAGTLSIIGNKLDLKSTNSLSVLLFLLTLSVLGFLLSRKWGNVFDNHMANVKNIVKDLSDSYGDDIGKYVELQKYEEKQPFIQECKRTKNLFNSFYVITIGVWSILLLITIYNKLSIIFIK